MNKKELIDQIAEDSGFSKTNIEGFLEAYINIVTDSLSKGESVQLVNFMTYKVGDRKATTGRNPRTGETIKIPASKYVRVIVGKGLKDRINGRSTGTESKVKDKSAKNSKIAKASEKKKVTDQKKATDKSSKTASLEKNKTSKK